MKLEKLRETIGQLAWSPPKNGKKREAINAILKHVEDTGGETLVLQWLLSYLDEPGVLEAGMRIVRQSEPPVV